MVLVTNRWTSTPNSSHWRIGIGGRGAVFPVGQMCVGLPTPAESDRPMVCGCRSNVALIASLLISLWVGIAPTKRTYEMLCFYLSGWASETELIAHLERFASESSATMQKLSRTLLPDGYLRGESQSTPGVATLSSSDVEDILSTAPYVRVADSVMRRRLHLAEWLWTLQMRSEKFYFVVGWAQCGDASTPG